MSGSAKCPTCGGSGSSHWATATDVEYGTLPGPFDYYHCDPCRTVFLSPMPVNQISIIYPSSYYSFGDPKLNWLIAVKRWLDRRAFRSLLRKVSANRLSVLDVGGGRGQQLGDVRACDDRVSETMVIDIDENAQAEAEAAGHRFWRGRFEDYVGNSTFDFIMLLNLIEHVSEPRAVLSKAGALLNRDGMILVKTPNWRSLDAALFRHRSWGGYHCPRHWILWDREGFQSFVEGCGLRVVEARYTQGAPFWAVSVLAAFTNWKSTPQRPILRHPLFAPLSAFFAVLDILRGPFSRTSQMEFILKKA